MKKLYIIMFSTIVTAGFCQKMESNIGDTHYSFTNGDNMIKDGGSSFVGTVIFDGKLRQGSFLVQEETIVQEFYIMDLNDKKLARFDIIDERGNRYKYDRKNKDDRGRLLFDVTGMQAYDRIIYFPNSNPNLNTLTLYYNGRETKYIDNVFRLNSADVKSFVRPCKVDTEWKEFLTNWVTKDLSQDVY